MNTHTTRRRVVSIAALLAAFAGSLSACLHQGRTDADASGTVFAAEAQPAGKPTNSSRVTHGLLHHEKYTLPNGMIVILHEDHSLPVATINTWYRVGAKNEPKGRSGFAHLFEHLMFMGTHRVPGSDFDNLMEAGGGANNASTSLDRTNYYSWGPASLLPTLLWLDADRLEDLGSAMNADKLKKQLDVVRNEIRQNVENTPYGRANEYANRFMYPEDHPYFWNAYGLHEDLEAATVENVKDFFATFYVPDNASLVVAGDFDSAKIKPLIARLFGTLPRGNVPQDKKVAPAKMDRVVRQTMLDKCQLPMLMIAYHSPAQYKAGDAEMDLAASVLAGGQNSRLYKRLVVKEQIAVDVGANQESSQLGSLFRITVLAKPDTDLTRLEQIVDEEIAALSKSGPTADELRQRVAQRESGMLNALQSIQSRADKLNEYEYYFGNPDSMDTDLNRFRNASVPGVAKWCTDVLTPGARLIIRVLPEDNARSAGAASAGTDNPRDKRPDPLPQGAFTPPDPQTFKLSSGANVVFWPKPGTGLVSATAVFGGQTLINDIPSAGLPTLMAEMLTEGTSNKATADGASYAAALQQLGASVGAGAGTHSVNVSLNTLSRTFDDSSKLWAEAIFSPRFDAKDFDRVKSLTLDNIRQADDEPTIVAGRVGMKLLFGDQNVYGWPANGTISTVTGLTLDKVTAARSMLNPADCTIFVSGDIAADRVKIVLENRFSASKGKPGATKGAAFSEPSRGDAIKVYIVNRPGAVQTVVRFFAPSVKSSSDQRVACEIVGTILGGSFTSRLNQNLREKNGFTYGAGCAFTHTRETGWFAARSSVQTPVTGAALREFLAEFARIRGGALGSSTGAGDITAEDVAKAVNTIRTDTVRGFSTLSGVLGLASGLHVDGLEWSSVAADLKKLDTYKAEDLNKATRDMIALEKGILVLVGDKAAIMPQLSGLGLPEPIEVDVNGEPVKK